MVRIKPLPPRDEAELRDRCKRLAGQSVATLANEHAFPIPRDLKRSKGWLGQLIEYHLGADATHSAEPDFRALQIEIKTLPIKKGSQEPTESTYVCTASLTARGNGLSWTESRVRRKLAHVLWIPIEADPALPLAQRTLSLPFLWRLTPTHEAVLRQDWEELTEILHLGKLDQLRSHAGNYLQLRPKAAHSQILTSTLSYGTQAESPTTFITPKGFYLRRTFTQQLLAEHFWIL